MKKISIIVAIAIAVTFMGCRGSGSQAEVNFSRDASYAVGLNIGTGLRDGMAADGVHVDVDEFLRGMRDAMTGATPRFSLDEAIQKIDEAFNAVIAARNIENIQNETDFLAENALRAEVNVTPSGLQYEVITLGDGPIPSAADTVRVHYEGTLLDGSVFDSSFARGEPAEFTLAGVIPGWREGLQLMNVGSTFRFYIPSELGYGPQGTWGIPPFATLIFVVELLDIVN